MASSMTEHEVNPLIQITGAMIQLDSTFFDAVMHQAQICNVPILV